MYFLLILNRAILLLTSSDCSLSLSAFAFAKTRIFESSFDSISDIVLLFLVARVLLLLAEVADDLGDEDVEGEDAEVEVVACFKLDAAPDVDPGRVRLIHAIFSSVFISLADFSLISAAFFCWCFSILSFSLASASAASATALSDADASISCNLSSSSSCCNNNIS